MSLWSRQRRVSPERWFPPALTQADLAALDLAVQQPPRAVGVPVANWNWKAVRTFAADRLGKELKRSSCFRALHRLGLVVKRPKKRLLKADATKRAQFVRDYAQLQREAQASGALLVFVDEAHFYADADRHGLWVRRGEPALIDSTSPRYGEKAAFDTVNRSTSILSIGPPSQRIPATVPADELLVRRLDEKEESERGAI